MKTKGIRILDKLNDVRPSLQEILNAIGHQDQVHWSILDFYGAAKLKNGKTIEEFNEEISSSDTGVGFSWEELNELAACMIELWSISIIGSKNKKLLRWYRTDQETYESCDIVIEKIDSYFWEVFSTDHRLINKLASKFKDVEFLESDFKNQWLPEGKYRQAREWGDNSTLVRDIDFTDHGRPDMHTNPHQHRWIDSLTDGTKMRGDPEPLLIEHTL